MLIQKISKPCPSKVNGNSKGVGGGGQKPNILKECIKLNQNFQRVGGFKLKKPSMGGVWMFSGTAGHQL